MEEFWAAESINPAYQDLVTPVPNRLDKDEIERKMALLGDIGLYY